MNLDSKNAEINPFAALERIFHEPNRLAIMSALCGADDGMTFNELKEACQLTDGNLSRHLKHLESAGVVRIEKSFVGARPRTTVFVSESGRDQFLGYLKTLENALSQAVKALDEAEKRAFLVSLRSRPAKA